MFCPMTKEECRQDCAWFSESRRKYPDHIDGKCLLVVMKSIPEKLDHIEKSIGKLERTIHNTEFVN